MNSADASLEANASSVAHLALGDIDQLSAALLASEVDSALEGPAAVAVIHINSFGGEVFAGLDLIGRIEAAKARTGKPVMCVVDRRAMSMAFVFLQSAACDVRMARLGSMLMDHKGAFRTQGTAHDIEKDLEMLKVIDRAMAEIICDRLGMTFEEHEKMVEGRNWFMSALEAKAYNAVDVVVP